MRRSDGSNTVGNPIPVLDANTGDLVLVQSHNLGQDTQDETQNVSQFVQPNFPPGDANGDGLVNLADLQQVLGDHWGYGASLDMTFKEALNMISLIIPEPTSLACMILAVSALSCRTSWGRKETVLHQDWTK